MTDHSTTPQRKSRFKYVAAGAAALALAGSTFVYAQSAPQAGPGLKQERGAGKHWRRGGMSAEDMQALADARIAAVKAGLRLTPEQEKNWPGVETAVREFAQSRISRAQARRAERAEGRQQAAQADPLARLKNRADTMAETAAGLKRIVDAADPLYKSLDDTQKRRLALLVKGGRGFGFGGMGEGRGHWGFHGGFHRGPGGPGGMMGPDRDDRGPSRL